MPFKLRLKRSRQYNVVSKSLFVISVELLEGTTVECTLSSESSGKECLDNVCQRLALQQPELFGLRYVNRHGSPRWVELERPVKKQLDKYALSPTLYLRVMYYISGISLLQDEMTRYHYFLQLKKDVLEGRINCNLKQATMLASYSMQAEFGSYVPERHTTEYLKDFALFPKHLVETEEELERATRAVIQEHAGLGATLQGTAEEYYILAAQHLDGYGQETFLAKDDCGNDVVIGVALTGIYVIYDNNNQQQHNQVYQWKDITNVVNHKRTFGMELHDRADPVQFTLPDIETAKYIWRMCVHQHTFFVQNESAVTDSGSTTQTFHNLFSQLADNEDNGNQIRRAEETEGHDEIDTGLSLGLGAMERARAQSMSSLELAGDRQLSSRLADVERLRALLPSYRPAPSYEAAVQEKYRSAHPSVSTPTLHLRPLYSSQPEIRQPTLHDGPRFGLNGTGNGAYRGGDQFPDLLREERAYLGERQGRHDSIPTSHHPLFHTHTYRSTPDLEETAGGRGVVVQLYKPPPSYRPNSNSTPDLALACHPPQLTLTSSSQAIPSLHPFLANSQSGEENQGNNLVYLMRHHHQQQQHAHHTLFSHRQEPIYENVPWRCETGGEEGPRSRAASIQSAPEMRLTAPPGGGQAEEEEAKPSPSQPQPHSQQVQHLPAAHDRTFNLSISGTSTLGDGSMRSSDGSTGTGGGKDTSGREGKGKGRKWTHLLGGSGSKSKSSGQPATPVQGITRVPLPPTISKEAMCQLLEKKLHDFRALFFEFEKIPKQKNTCNFTTAALSENIPRNRFNDVLPYEETRVRLSPSKENKFGYINASHITVTVGSQQRFYISAQSPLPTSIKDFWQMIWESEVYLVVSLPAPGDADSASYLPTPDRSLTAGKFEVMCQFSQMTGHCATSKLSVHHVDNKSFRGIWHLQYAEWGHQGCPNSAPHFLGFLEEVSSVRQHIMTEIPVGHNKNPPVLVHCSSGVGPAAVTILSDLLLFTIDHNQELDIPRVVYLLRQQRMLMIQNISQYSFIHALIIYYLKNSRLI